MRFDPAADPYVTGELLSLILGEYLGGGVARQVYVYLGDPTLVVKIEVGQHDYQNIAEWQLWAAADTDLEKWLAPCVRISPGGRVLLQRRCEKIPSSLMPEKVPACLASDFHRDNVGWYEGRPVAMDYGRHTALKMTANAKRMSAPAYFEGGEDLRRTW